MSTLPKDYIGDSVYIQDTGFGVILTTENGAEPSNRIEMEPEVVIGFLRYIERMRQHYAPKTTDS